ncbi:Receptor-type guanylate cyclase gcy [Seminavis robusta]|uniref:Receptor-type guanylate cyclase gcy n=1 Tax=Seminavis robusta TaxID=568900 RepID=A0A9N8HAU7_9STRA|nr:Receptor-type guanylate cyclase gcy [Seminavis robusta]|eukprot:Sro160_g072290.1 Receptor-type guanylate cyclase gcy (1229) ;mRNA; r:84930-90131
MMSRAASKSFDSDDDSIMASDDEMFQDDDDHTSTKASGTLANNSSDESTSTIKNRISKKESQNVFRLRLLVVLVLLLTALAISYTVYWLTSSAEAEEFKVQYEGAAEKIIASFEDIMHKMGSISTLGVAFTAYSVNFGDNWPFIALPNFQQRAGNARHMSGALFVGVAPVVTRENFDAWDEYVTSEDNRWIDEADVYQEQLGMNGFGSMANYHKTHLTDRKVDLMHRFDATGKAFREETTESPYFPLWQTSPFVNSSGLVNRNILCRKNVTQLIANVMTTESAYLGDILRAPPGNSSDPNTMTALFATLMSMNEGHSVPYGGEPLVEMYLPIFDAFNESQRRVVGILKTIINWESYLRNILPSNVNGIEVVIDYECAGAEQNLIADTDKNGEDAGFTFLLNGPEVKFIAYGDQHEGFDEWMRNGNLITDNLDDGTVRGIEVDPTCSYDIHVYPTQKFYDHHHTSMPMVITWSIVAVFLFTIGVFLFYDHLVEYRQSVVLKTATQTTAIVSSLFPRNVRKRLLETDNDGHLRLSTKSRLKSFVINGDAEEIGSTAAPIADLYPQCTVFFGDICGFTVKFGKLQCILAWSSTREPAQVFVLLQSLYQAYDVLAKRRRVFKVETIGDCYMAVTGLPEPQEKHAINMVRFAWDALLETNKVTKRLECSLGPDTADLTLRIGIHSGPVTAGVLRGDRARFQLFGDTVNTASRMETTGRCGKIQISEATASILRESAKEHWLTPREDMVNAKGKGIMIAYWAHPSCLKGSVASGESSEAKSAQLSDTPTLSADERLVEWVVDLILYDIKKILHTRMHSKPQPSTEKLVYHPPSGKICLDEIQDIVHMPEYNASIAACRSAHDDISVNKAVVSQLREYVGAIANMYRGNFFHNFEHACHVVMSSKKLLTRIVTPELSEEQLEKLKRKKHAGDLACHIHKFTYGINSEPLALLAVTFSSLIHDVDHRGISNMQMMKEEPDMAHKYRGKSIAECNSLDLAWDLFMEDRFQDLRRCMFLNQQELLQFRQLVVNIVLATDIFDKDLNGLRRSRWEQAFADHHCVDFDTDLRATIVLEHIIQASDVSHTMQHWQVYQKWNKRLFREMTHAFKNGKLAKDPATFWYRGELGFFDNYIIPLAGKLKECGVFGVSSDEYLNYAVQNRAEWAERGEQLVEDMVADMQDPSEHNSRRGSNLVASLLDNADLYRQATESTNLVTNALYCQPADHPESCDCCKGGKQ